MMIKELFGNKFSVFDVWCIGMAFVITDATDNVWWVLLLFPIGMFSAYMHGRLERD